jgi:hypothetical protein
MVKLWEMRSRQDMHGGSSQYILIAFCMCLFLCRRLRPHGQAMGCALWQGRHDL